MNCTSLFARKLATHRKAMVYYKTDKALRKACILSIIYAKKDGNALDMRWYVQVNRNRYVNQWSGGYLY